MLLVSYNARKEEAKLKNININELNKTFKNIIDSVIKYNEVVKVNSEKGNVVIISEEDYNGMIATIELSSNPKLKQKILDGKNTKIEDCIDINN